MRKLEILLIAFIISITAFGQAPEGMSYQAVIKDAQNRVLISKKISIKISIIKDSNHGSAVYSETQSLKTNSNGMVSLTIGAGDTQDSFGDIDWAFGSYYIKTEIDPKGGNNYAIKGTSQLLSVPYALHAKTAEGLVGYGKKGKPKDGSKEIDPIFINSDAFDITAEMMDGWDIDNVDDADNDPTNEMQNISLVGTILSISDKNFVDLGLVTGPEGPQGETGLQGPIGPKGEIGPEGPLGPAGKTGLQGEVGAQGPAGADGLNGQDGAIGVVGPKGAQGEQGLQGDPGLQGEIGPKGPSGADGQNGLVGEAGALGPQGPQGEIGPHGPVGKTGPQGEIGLHGPVGKTGLQGEIGPKGPAGADGQNGSMGEVGAIGPQGLQGEKGAIGPKGEIGPEGPHGSVGITGPQGPAGADGQNGLVGDAGEIGPQGPQGEKGALGLKGEIGPEGPHGPAGKTGPQGPAGEVGALGQQGPQGDIGPKGPQGLAGPQGDQGPAGGDGPQGVPGADGLTTSVNGVTQVGGVITLTTANITPSPNKNYITGAQQTVIGNTSGTNTGDNAENSLYSGLVTNATHTGDVTGDDALTIGTNKVITTHILDANVTDDKIASVSASKLSDAVAIVNGGTNIATYAQGDILYASATDELTKLTKGTASQVLTMNAGATAPEWVSPTSSGAAHEIGDTYGGGIIFYLDSSGLHGLIAASTDQSGGIQWYNGTYSNTTAFSSCVGCGDGNTSMIVFNQGSGSYAAKLCYDLTLGGYNDWYLPSKYELDLIYENIGPGNALGLGNVGGLVYNNYWSSTEHVFYKSWSRHLGSGFHKARYKIDNTASVRAIRAF